MDVLCTKKLKKRNMKIGISLPTPVIIKERIEVPSFLWTLIIPS
jgi:hypothetical protein